MKRNLDHIIQRQSIEIHFEDLDDAFGIQNSIREIFYEHLQPVIEALLNERATDEKIIAFERVEIDCGILTHKTWKRELIDCTARKLKESLRLSPYKEISGEAGIHDQAFESFLFFVEYGHLPWNSRFENIQELEKLLSLDERSIAILKEKLFQSPRIADRIAIQCPESFCNKLAQTLMSDEPGMNWLSVIKPIVTPIAFHTFAFRTFSHFRNETVLHDFLTQARLEAGKNEPDRNAILDLLNVVSNQPKETKNNITFDDAIYIANAGLVLVHPFLPALFKNLGIFQDRQWVDPEAQHKAASILEFLVNGNDQLEELHAPLNKILCGIHPSEVLLPFELVPFLKDECEVMLREIISHWKILKNTSVQGFRETLLQRPGKLTQVDDGWLLHVEQRGVDVLLKSLPWGIGTIKLPWMKSILHVEWT